MRAFCGSFSANGIRFSPNIKAWSVCPWKRARLKSRYLLYTESADCALAEAAYQKYRDTLDQARGQIWGVLTPRQMQEWKAMVRRVGGQS